MLIRQKKPHKEPWDPEKIPEKRGQSNNFYHPSLPMKIKKYAIFLDSGMFRATLPHRAEFRRGPRQPEPRSAGHHFSSRRTVA